MNLSLFKSEYPFASNYIDLNGLKYHYLDEGSGDPVVMVHGNPSWSFYYRDLAKELRNNYRVIVPDHIGCGLSDKPDDSRYSYTLQQRVDDLDALLEHLDIGDKVTLVVHDWGGMIGMAWASRHPEKIARLVILNTAAFHLPEAKPFPLGLKICRDTGLGTFLVRGSEPVCPWGSVGRLQTQADVLWNCRISIAAPTITGRTGLRHCVLFRISR